MIAVAPEWAKIGHKIHICCAMKGMHVEIYWQKHLEFNFI
jgi:hypothetical protein